MTLWHKPTEKPRRKGEIMTFHKGIIDPSFKYYNITDKLCYAGGGVVKWCYLSDLLKLEREYKRLLLKVMEQQEEITNLKLDYVHQGRILGTLQTDYKRETGKDWEFIEEY